jgi:hypothetical protein
LLACGGPAQTTGWPTDGLVHVELSRDDEHPNYRCVGDVEMLSSAASFACTAEGFDAWSVRGAVEQTQLPDTLRFWIRDAGGAHATGQPDIAIDLQPHSDHYLGWATIVLPDGTDFGHPDAVAEAWAGGAQARPGLTGRRWALLNRTTAR